MKRSAQAKAWRERWKRINADEEEELRKTSPAAALQQLESLYALIDFLGWRDALSEGESQVREKWVRLKQRYAKRSK